MDITTTPFTATPVELNPLAMYVRHSLIPAMISRQGKLNGVNTPGVPTCEDERNVQRFSAVANLRGKLPALLFTAHMTPASKKSFEAKVSASFFDYFATQSNTSRPLIASDQGKELLGNMIKGFYGAFPFVEKRRVVLSLRDLSINIMTKIPVEGTGGTLPDNLANAMEQFNNSVDYFHATATPYHNSNGEASNDRLWSVKIADYTRALRSGTSAHTKSQNHPASKAARLMDEVLRRTGTSHPFHNNDAVHLNKYLLEDFDQVFSFLKYFLEYLPCKTAS